MNRIAYVAAREAWAEADARVFSIAPWWPSETAAPLPPGLANALDARATAESNMMMALQMTTGDVPGFWDGGRWLSTARLWSARGA